MFRRVFLARLLLAALFGALLVPAQAQEKFSEPALSDPDSWTVVLLPDLQGYAKKACNQPIMEIMTSWIAAHAEALNTKLVLCVGDLVEQNASATATRATSRRTSSGRLRPAPSRSWTEWFPT